MPVTINRQPRLLVLLLLIALSFAMVGNVSAAQFPESIPLPNGFQPEGIASGPGTTFYVGSIPTGASPHHRPFVAFFVGGQSGSRRYLGRGTAFWISGRRLLQALWKRVGFSRRESYPPCGRPPPSMTSPGTFLVPGMIGPHWISSAVATAGGA